MMKTQLTISSGLIFAACGVAYTQNAAPLQLAIKLQPLDQAITAWAQQTGYQVLLAEQPSTAASPAVEGAYTPAAALQMLLADTGLQYHFVNSRTVAIGGAASTSAGPTSSERTLEEVVVTAQKREERLVDVPMSIVAMTASELQRRKVSTLEDLAASVPGLMSQSNGGYVRRIQMRGIGNVTGDGSLIGLYLDEAAVTSGANTQLDLRTYDLERVEVLRGPQGTLYGDGSLGGTIRFITKNPVLNQFDATANVVALSTEHGSSSERVEGAVNLPLVEDQLGLRIVGTYDHEGGWVDQPASGDEDFNSQNVMNVRVKGLWQPSPQFSLSMMAVVHRRNGAPSNGEDDNGNYSQTFNIAATPGVEDDYDLYNSTITYDFSSVRFLVTGSYVEQDNETRNTGNRIPFFGPSFPSLAVNTALDLRRRRDTTGEMRLSSIDAGPWQWTVGAFFRHHRFREDIPTNYVGFEGPPGTPLPEPSEFHSSSRSESWAVFGDSSYKLTDRLTLGAGVRYFEDDQEQLSTTPVQNGRFDSVNPRAYAQYKLTDNANVYASVAKGFRSGGFNNVDQPAYDPESVWTYELGTKMVSATGALSAELAIFYSDYTDYQISGNLPPPAPPLAYIHNAGSARIQGIEWGFAWRPMDQWELSFSGNYLDTEFYDIDVLASPYNVGDPLDLIPPYQFNIGAQREFRLGSRAGFARVDYSQNGRETFRNRNIFGPSPWYFSESNIINLLSFNMGLQLTDNLSFGVFGRNLLNDRGYTDAASINGVAARSRPRTYGIEFGISFR